MNAETAAVVFGAIMYLSSDKFPKFTASSRSKGF